jgi:micrococcal nuclease
MARAIPLALALVFSLLLPAACSRAAPAPSAGEAGIAVVVAVIDGDTIAIEAAGRREHVRLVGIDTPESVDPQRPVECHGPEASHLLAELLPVGTEVRLERDIEARDRYGRLLAYVFRRPDGLFVNQAVAEAGEAEVLEVPPNTAYSDALAATVGAARAAGRGLWGACPAE